MVCVKKEKLIKIYQWLGDNNKIEFKETANKISIFYPKLEKLNPEYARKHADIVDAGRKTDGRRTEDGRSRSNRSKRSKGSKKEDTPVR